MTEIPPLAGGGGYTISLEEEQRHVSTATTQNLSSGHVTHLMTGPEKVG